MKKHKLTGFEIVRRRNELTQAELGKILGVSQEAVSNWETGKAFPTASTLCLMRQKLECTIDELLRV